MKNILLLGATGSIGDSVLNVIRQNDSTLNLFGIAVGKNIKKTDGIIKEFLPKYVFVDDVIAYDDISSSNPDKNILNSDQELLNLISDDKVDIVISAIVGFAGLKASLMAVNAGKTVLIANKESIVAAGDILMPLARSKGSTIIPIDSEHNAIFQCLPEDKTTQDVDKIIITASGGPFIDIPLSKLSNISPQDALKHPNWQMGSKISIDSATLVNKCLELIEARYLFNLNEKFFDLVVHPQSIIHSIVTYKDGSSISQMSNPNMEVPIANALGDSSKVGIEYAKLDFTNLKLSFQEFPSDRSKLQNLAREICNAGGSSGLVFNAANEIAVEYFLKNRLKFSQIYDVIYRTFDLIPLSNPTDIETLNELNNEARIEAKKVIKSIT
ncbi:1-deoxy-D-xylulose-5-phosphate reductoisomerase [Gammaproteobacteria bacterium]|nr:1-deoxy-D-xylulose-5-phosphate reductoisomerase [Gammaproteobacteria bacterium]|tara:strand:+ start:88 stop:1239 length:1152 start_codon:yes stop_codon:yes gene_type:complete